MLQFASVEHVSIVEVTSFEDVRHHSLGLMAIRVLVTAHTPQIKPTGNSSDPDSFVFSNGRKTATCAADAAAKPVINFLLEGSEKLFWLAASCSMTQQ